jgi:micrococcal nuclease
MDSKNLPRISVLLSPKWLICSLIVILTALNLHFYRQLEDYKEIQGKYKVVRVLDGDSFVIDLDQTVRLANLDAPELEFCYGKEAKENLEKLLSEKYVKIEGAGRDKFGRILGMVYLNGQFINGMIVKNGWARYASGGSENQVGQKKAELIRKSAHEAQDQGLGIWSPKCYQKENLENPACVIKGNIGKSYEEKTYHLPGCSEYERTVVERDLGEQWFCTEEEAQKAGYRKSEHCFN